MKPKSLPKWKRKLTASQLKHVKETTQRSTLAEVKVNLAHQELLVFPCFDCIQIANRLGI
jgi:hypothetical protein